jgi:quercetin dioxygenase-like cupin family protein
VAGYVLRGHVEIHAGADVLQLAPGEGFHLSAGLPHSMANPGSEPAEVLCVTTHPAGSSR